MCFFFFFFLFFVINFFFFFFFSSRRRHTRFDCDWSSDVWLFRSRKLPGSGALRFGKVGTPERYAGAVCRAPVPNLCGIRPTRSGGWAIEFLPQYHAATARIPPRTPHRSSASDRGAPRARG